MEPKDYLIIFTVVSLIFIVIYATYTIPAQINLNATSYPRDLRVIISFIAYTLLTITTAAFIAFAYRTSRPLTGIGRKTMEYFILALIFCMLGPLPMALGLGLFIILGSSYIAEVWYGLIYPSCLPVAMMFTCFAAYFMLKFGYFMSERREPDLKNEIPLLVLIICFLAVSVHPYNWYGMIVPTGYPSWRLYTNSLLLIVNLIAIAQVAYFLLRKIRTETDPIRIARLKMVMLGFLALLGFFMCYAIDALAEQPYTVWMFLGYIFAILSPILLYVGTAAPKWFISRIETK